MASIIKVDQIQTAAGGTPTAADLGINTTGNVLQVVRGEATTFNSISGGTSDVEVLSVPFTPKFANSTMIIQLCYIPYANHISTNTNITFGIRRNTTPTSGTTWPNGGGTTAYAQYKDSAVSYLITGPATFVTSDQPNTTTQVNYRFVVNAITNSVYIYKGCSLTITEIAG